VKIDGEWYSIPVNLSRTEIPFVIEPTPQKIGGSVEHTVDFSGLKGLPTGQYRLVERFFLHRLQYEYFAVAYFWVIEPGEERPPESETSGDARDEDIVFRVESLSEARRAITDLDNIISMSVENLSGKSYESFDAVLERKESGTWVEIGYQHANLGLMFGWSNESNMLFLNEPLVAGDYRLRLLMRVFGTSSEINPEYEFSVIPYDNAPEPKWDTSRLYLSGYDAAKQSAGVTINLANPVLSKENTELDFILAADDYYFFGEQYTVEVLLEGKWYCIPFAHGFFNDIGYSISPETEEAGCTYSCNPVFAFGVLPVGQYRMIKVFDLFDPETRSEPPPAYLAKENAIAEFSVVETLDSATL
jgi:hypothetical protein